jgi:hypothetical protein
LRSLGSAARAHPGYKRALVLINDTFRKSSIAKRRAVLDAADWLISLLDQLTAPSQPMADTDAGKIRRTLRPAADIAVATTAARNNIRDRQLHR